MTDGVVVVCDEDGVLFGQGKSKAEALKDAEEWIEDAVRQQVTAEIQHLKSSPSNRVSIDLTWTVKPATAALMASIGVRGGHTDYHERSDGVLDLGRAVGKQAELHNHPLSIGCGPPCNAKGREG